MRKLTLLLAVGIGYVLGARAGRERYEQLKSLFVKVKDDPHVRSAASSVAETAKEQAPVVAQKVTQAAGAAAGAAGAAAGAAASVAAEHSPFGQSEEEKLKEQLNPDSTALQDDPYPKGDLP